MLSPNQALNDFRFNDEYPTSPTNAESIISRNEDSKQQTTTKHLECHICHKCYSYKYYLKIHIDNHSNIRNYQCRYCEIRFNSFTNRLDHERRHFHSKQVSLKRPQIHFRNYSCVCCGKQFYRRYLLTKHIQTKHGYSNKEAQSIIPYSSKYSSKWRAQSQIFEISKATGDTDTHIQQTQKIIQNQSFDESQPFNNEIIQINNCKNAYTQQTTDSNSSKHSNQYQYEQCVLKSSHPYGLSLNMDGQNIQMIQSIDENGQGVQNGDDNQNQTIQLTGAPLFALMFYQLQNDILQNGI